jgi:hypothetical protein
MGDALTRLAGRLRGELLLPNDHGYDDARRGYNQLHDRRPAVVVRPADGEDVARALEFAASAGLEVAVRSGGHSLAGFGATEGGALIDLSAMHASTPPEAQTFAALAPWRPGLLRLAEGPGARLCPSGRFAGLRPGHGAEGRGHTSSRLTTVSTGHGSDRH